MTGVIDIIKMLKHKRALYGELHACDAAGASWIIVETVPQKDEWRAIADRLKRAAG